ncbi:MAG TPA: hypothetical protein VK837_03110 [Longimicrobiales bacterium]|nr:hypothetical protein [Longimicrobiales bacterium]
MSEAPPDAPTPAEAASAPAGVPIAVARLRLFGNAPTPAKVVVVERGPGWRASRAFLAAAAAVGLAALAALVPPHVPWAAIVLTAGLVLAFRRARERRTLLALTGTCPGCAAKQALERPTRLRAPHRLPCSGCGRVLELTVDDGGV